MYLVVVNNMTNNSRNLNNKRQQFKKIRRLKKNRNNKTKANLFGRILFLSSIIVMVLLFLFGRVTYYKVAKGNEYEIAARAQNSNQTKTISPIRGSILDRNGQELAKSNLVYRVILDTQVMEDEIANMKKYGKEEKIEDENGLETIVDQRQKTLNELSAMTGVSPQEIEQKMEPKSQNANGTFNYSRYNRIGTQEISRKEHDEFLERNKNMPWIHFEASSKRVYPYNFSASYLLGFTGSGVGVSGIEYEYNDYLIGSPGRSFTTYRDGGLRETNLIEANNGDTVITTIDLNLQQILEEAVANAMINDKPLNAAAIAMNPNTGEILGLASNPGFDLNDPYDLAPLGLDTSNMTDEEVAESRNKLWRNYNISDTYEPGSTFKVVTVAAALEEEIIKKTEPFYCGGYRNFKGLDEPIRCWKREGHGAENLEQALANSCNPAMMDIGAKMGQELFYKYLRAFGFGEQTKIDLPGEPASYTALVRNADQISDIDLANMSFGQSFNATPLQLINAFAAVINGGNLMKPFVVSQVVDNNNNVVLQNNTTIERKVISKEVSDIVRQFLETTIEEGTGKKAKIDGYRIGGKTGTAQQGKKMTENNEYKYVVSFAAFAPVDNPEVLVLALLDQPAQRDESSAAPMLKEIMEKTIKYLGIEPISGMSELHEEDSIILDDFSGLQIMEANLSLSMLNLDVEVIGSGSVVERQFPQAGAEIKAGDKITIWAKRVEGSQKVSTPNLVGANYDEANAILNDLGLVPVVEGSQTGTVISQEPQEGTDIDAGGSIKLKFGE